MLSTLDLRGHTVLALHAHPDDEAIFTGITLRRLADAGARIVLVMATSGELGESRVPLGRGESISDRRIAELEHAAALLGVARLELLSSRDSGLPGWSSATHPRALANADTHTLAARIARIAEQEGAGTLIYDDEQGIYGHPDHQAAFRIGSAAATMSGATGYRMTVDRDHLNTAAPGGHLVHGAASAAAVDFGRSTSEITLAVTGNQTQLAAKYSAITAHASQIGHSDVPAAVFQDAYGTEWFRREEPTGLLDLLSDVHVLAGATG
ncbi:PIG-L deacetylase family protein [Pseudonocardia spinosispora]|uniref:PIG-L deacetylase family protein n=1 Tax=Pseudonocardia spinosispora TaxID=103441 RepID=UPI0004125B33|nr:PIG-L family deacetylase [Pseudonocardia spinosispora]